MDQKRINNMRIAAILSTILGVISLVFALMVQFDGLQKMNLLAGLYATPPMIIGIILLTMSALQFIKLKTITSPNSGPVLAARHKVLWAIVYILMGLILGSFAIKLLFH